MTNIITLVMDSKTQKKIDIYKEKNDYPSRSAAIRYILNKFLEQEAVE